MLNSYLSPSLPFPFSLSLSLSLSDEAVLVLEEISKQLEQRKQSATPPHLRSSAGGCVSSSLTLSWWYFSTANQYNTITILTAYWKNTVICYYDIVCILSHNACSQLNYYPEYSDYLSITVSWIAVVVAFILSSVFALAGSSMKSVELSSATVW